MHTATIERKLSKTDSVAAEVAVNGSSGLEQVFFTNEDGTDVIYSRITTPGEFTLDAIRGDKAALEEHATNMLDSIMARRRKAKKAARSKRRWFGKGGRK